MAIFFLFLFFPWRLKEDKVLTKENFVIIIIVQDDEMMRCIVHNT